MKVLRLRFRNLNSLAGDWDIDFTHPDYVSSGIFAITGPTGAGKTTILDAICLALYGQTPRLGRITQSENEIMSRQTGECFAEVEFETARGRFRCHWSQHRSRKLADGQLQQPRHEIAEAGSGLILESKLKAVAGKVEDVTGMDFDRFTRSMLLAQGGFAAFLQAGPDERAPILEQITGTGIYSLISIKVHERTAEERKRLGEMRAELDSLQLLSPEEADSLLLEKSKLQRTENSLITEVQIIREAESWRERIAALEGELLKLNQDRIAFKMRKEAAAPKLERLALAGRALNLGGDHAHILLLRTQKEEDKVELKSATDRLPRLQFDWQTAVNALELAEAGLTRNQVGQTQEAELIRMTRELDIKLGQARAQLLGLTVDFEKTERRNSDYRQAITECDQRIIGTEEELQGIVTFLGEHQPDAGLVEALTGIEQQLKALKALDKQCRDTQDKLGQHAAQVESFSLTLVRTEAVWQVARQTVTEAENRLLGIRADRDELLQGRDLSTWRTEAETFATRQNRLGIIQESLARIEEVKPKLTALKQRVKELEQNRQTLVHQENTLSKECELREQVARQLQDNVILLNRVRSLEDDRKQLVDGVPCPLCGSSEHPYAADNIPEMYEAQQELELALAEAKMVREQLSHIKLEQVAVVKDLHRAEQDQAELQGRLLRDETFCADASVELGMVVESDVTGVATAWPEIIRHESYACREMLVNRHGIIRDAEQKELEERSAQVALNTLKDELAELDKARLAALLGQEAAMSDQKRLEAESAAIHDDLNRAQAEVENLVAAYACKEIVPDKADQLLASLTSRRNEYVNRMQVKDHLERVRDELAAERVKLLALLAESEKTSNDMGQRLRDITAQRDALVERRLEQYGERNPDSEEIRLAETLRLAWEQREEALREQNRLQAELGGLNGQIKRLTQSIAQRGEQLSEREAAFSLRLIETGFADEAAFLQACLSQERFDELTQWADTLLKDETAMQTRQNACNEKLACELNKNLTDKDLDRIREEHTAITARLSELHMALGGIEQKLQQHAEQRQRQSDRLQAMEVQKKESARWERLHVLIGSSDGKKFRNFAQGLTFELMVAHANRQLQKMSDRYILVRDNSAPLELNVIDNYQAGEIRSTKNLSGGESFIASLALSLGLSSMASRNVRVDSLFLDEGFGTLDEDALETALETLSGLQQDGKLIGIISHVPALKERIGTRIQVEAGSSGRSSLSGPGCRRVT